MALKKEAVELMWSDALGRQLEGNGGIVQAIHLVKLVEAYYNVGQDEAEATSTIPDTDFLDTESEGFVADESQDSTPPTAIAVAEQEAITPRAKWPFPGDAEPVAKQDHSNWPYPAEDSAKDVPLTAAAPSPAPAPSPVETSVSAPAADSSASYSVDSAP